MPGRSNQPPADFAINATEADPLLHFPGGEVDHGNDQDKTAAGHKDAAHGHGSAFNAFFTMASACAGAGILSLPHAAMLIGVVPVIFTLVVFGIINSFTLWLLSSLTDIHRKDMDKTQFSYEQLVLCVLGPRVGQIFSGIIVLTQFGSLTAYWVILLDLSIPVMEQHHWLEGLSMHSLRTAVAYFLAGAVLFPLSFYEKIHDLWAVVVLAIASVVWTAGILVSEGVQAEQTGTDAGKLDHVSFAAINWVQTLPAIVFTYNCHQQLTPVYGWTRPDVRNLVRKYVMPASILFCSVTYMMTAVAGYVKFGDKTRGDILLNFNNRTLSAEWKSDSSKLLMALHVVLVYPVVLFPLLRALDSELPKTCTSEGSMVGTGIRNLFIVLMTATLAIFLPDVQVVFNFVGGVLAAQSVFIFPCVMMLYTLLRAQKSAAMMDQMGDAHVDGTVTKTIVVVSCWALLGLGLFLVGSSVYTSVT
eukprot:m.178025 g.178025  ORF g.178025 m.178025 type:complete len:473 (+) comp14463_c0_seq1:303-1721(+)